MSFDTNAPAFGYIFNEDTNARVHTNTPIYPEIPETRIENISYEVLESTGEDRLVFDLVNAPPSHANALRRTLLSNVPSIALEVVGITKNDGIMPDEMLCHRLGLIPLNIEPGWLETPEEPIENDSQDPKTTLLFALHVIGGEGPDPDPDVLTQLDSSYEDSTIPPYYTGESGLVLSSHLIWLPFPDQRNTIPPVHPLHLDVPITKLRPGQEIELTARAIRSIGKDHAKFSPVCTAFYRLVPLIEVRNELLDSEAKKLLVKSCPKHIFQYSNQPVDSPDAYDPNVNDIDIEDVDIEVRNSRRCTSCRECIRDPLVTANGSLTVGKEVNRYEFTVESVGVRPAHTLVKEALQILRQKCDELKEIIKEEVQSHDEDK